jgi:hypothetical protein
LKPSSNRVAVTARCLLVVALALGVVSAVQLAAVSHGGQAGADAATGSAGLFVPATGRLLDTRNGTGGFSTPMPAGSVRTVTAAGRAGIPASGVSAVALTLTAIGAGTIGSISVAPGDVATPTGAALVFNPGDSISNTALVALHVDGTLHVLADHAVNLIIDVQGYFTAGSATAPGGFVAVDQARVADSRSGSGVALAKVAAGGSVTVQAGGSFEIPADASAVYANITVLNQTANGYLRAYAADQPAPTTGALDFDDSATAQSVAIPLSADGRFTVLVGAGGPVDLAIDIQGYFTASASSGSFTPAAVHLLDTRVAPVRTLAGNSVTTLSVAGVAGIPAVADGLGAVALNLRTIQPTTGAAGGYLRLWPSDQIEPATSNVNYTTANTYRTDLAIVAPAADGTINIRNGGPGPVDLVVDVEGWFMLSAPSLTSTYYLPNAAIETPYAETAADFSWAPNGPGVASYQYQQDGGAPVTAPATQTQLAWYPTSAGSHILRLWTVNSSGVTSPAAAFSFIVAAQAPPSVPEFLQTAGVAAGAPFVSGVITSPAGGELDADFYLTDASGAAVGQTPYATAAGIQSGHRATLSIPAGSLTAGNSYHWTMTACSAQQCSAPSPTQSFVYALPPTPPAPVTTTVTLPPAAVHTSDAPTGSSACAGSPCTQTADGTLKVGSDGSATWRSYLTFDLSAIPAGARVSQATLTLGTPTTIGSAGPAPAVDLYAMGASWSASTAGDVLTHLTDPAAAATSPIGPATLDVSELVQFWVTGDHQNYGIALLSSGEQSGYGTSFPSASASSGTPQLTISYQAAAAPGVPTDLNVVAGDSAALISWSPPADSGNGAADVSYVVTASDSGGNVLSTRTVASTVCTIAGLANGSAVSIAVAATTPFGTSAAASASAVPAAISPSAQGYLDSARQYLAARDYLANAAADTPAQAVTGMTNSAAVLDQLVAEAPSILSARQERVVHQAGHPSGGSPQLANAVVGPIPGSDEVGVWTDVADSVLDGGSGPTASHAQLLLRFSAAGKLDGTYDERDSRPSGPTSLDATAVVTTSALYAAPLATSVTDPPVPVNEDASSWPSTDPPSADAVAASVAVPAYRHTLNPNAMVAWADQHYDDPWQYNPDCTGWASRALHEGGGMAYKSGWYKSDQNWWRNRTYWVTHQTYSYSNAQHLANFLGNNPGQWITSTALARPGDILFYRFNDPHQGGDRINHTAVIVENNKQWGLYVAQSDDNYSYRSVYTGIAGLQRQFGRVTLYIRRVYNSSS